MKNATRIIAILTLSVVFASCVVDVPTETEPQTPTAETPEPTKPETVPQEEPMKAPAADPVTTDLPATPPPAASIPPVAPKPVVLRPLPIYPAYIIDQCGALWGIPSDLQGEYNKVHLTVETASGDPVSMNEVDIFTLDGSLYLTRKHISDGKEAIDYYKQTGNTITLVDSTPAKPVESRVRFDSPYWSLETTVLSGIEYSYLYNRDPDMINAQGNSGGKGAFMKRFNAVSAFVVLEKGILVMSDEESLFFPQNRACGSHVSEKGRMWK